MKGRTGAGRVLPPLLAMTVSMSAAGTALADSPPASQPVDGLLADTLREVARSASDALNEVADLMTSAARQLQQGRAGPPGRQAQQRCLDILDALIRSAGQQPSGRPQPSACRQCGGRGCQACRPGQAQASARPAGPARTSGVVQATAEAGQMHDAPVVRPGEMWGRMRPEERDRILQSLQQAFPARYRALVEQYYRRLATE